MTIEDSRDRHLLRLLEAVLFASAGPLSEQELTEYLTDEANVPALLAALIDEYAARGVNLVQAGKGWCFTTAPDLAPFLTRQRKIEKRLSRAGIETLAVIAYHQPVTRGEIEEIRGVQLSKGTLDALFEQGWIEPRGRRETPGRPVTWATTDDFLRHFRLRALTDLPAREELLAAGLLDTRPAIRVLQPDSGPAGDDGESVPEPLDPDAR